MIWLLLTLIILTIPASSATVSLTFDPVDQPNIAGYRIYYGTASTEYHQMVDIRKQTSYTIPGLTASLTYYFAVTAYDRNGNESDYSNEVSFTPTFDLADGGREDENAGYFPDTDADGIDDDMDTDDDGDGMPDLWEIENDLEPLKADGAGDKDGDGFSNYEEYLKGSDPGVADLARPAKKNNDPGLNDSADQALETESNQERSSGQNGDNVGNGGGCFVFSLNQLPSTP